MFFQRSPRDKQDTKQQSHPLQHGPNTQTHRKPVFRFWTWELVLLAVAIACIVTISVVINSQNGKPVQDWTFYLTLNSLSAVLSTLLRGAMVSVAAEIISQDKWALLWSSRSPNRSLLTLQAFDQGSRGIWGALALVPTAARRSPSTLIALLVVLVSFAVGPFVQQAIRTDERLFRADNVTGVSLPIAQSADGSSMYYRHLGGQSIYGTWDMRPAARGEFMNALVRFDSNTSNAMEPTCPTGECTFPRTDGFGDARPGANNNDITHASVGLCSRCFNVTSLTMYDDKTGHVRLPPGSGNLTIYHHSGTEGSFNISAPYRSDLSWASAVIDLATQSRPEIRWSLTNLTLLTSNVHTDANQTRTLDGWTAVTCSIYACLRHYSAAVSDGVSTERLVRTTPMLPDVASLNNNTAATGDAAELMQELEYTCLPQSGFVLTAIQSPCRVDDVLYTHANMSDVVRPGHDSVPLDMMVQSGHGTPGSRDGANPRRAPKACVYKMHCFMRAMLAGLLDDGGMLTGDCAWNTRQGPFLNCADRWWLSLFWEDGRASLATVAKRVADFTDAATNVLRRGTGREEGTLDRVEGTAFRRVTVTTVEWEWLLLPILMLAVETAVLGWVVVRTWRRSGTGEMVWKSGVLPLMYYRDVFVDEVETGRMPGVRTAGKMKGGLMTSEEIEREARFVEVKRFGMR